MLEYRRVEDVGVESRVERMAKNLVAALRLDSRAVHTEGLIGQSTPLMSPSWSRIDLLMLAVLAAAVAFFYWPILTPDASQRMYIVAGDFTNQFYPYHYFAASEWWAGRVPLWNPYMFGGHPFQADIQTAVFYPLALITNLVAGRQGLPITGLELQGVMDYFLAAVFTYVLLRLLVGYRLASLLGAGVFSFGGYLTSYPFQQLAVLESSIWLPLIILLVEIGVRRGPRWSIGAGLAMATTVLAGHPQTVLFTAYVVGAYWLFRIAGNRLRWRSISGSLVVFGLVAAGASAVQWLPTMELMSLSTRAAISYEVAGGGYDYSALPGLLLPEWRGEKALYLGIVTLLLALLAVVRGPRKDVLFWAGVGLVALILSFGDRGLLYRLFHAIAPGFDIFKNQERSAFIFSFAGSVLSAYGLAALRKNLRPSVLGFALAIGAMATAPLIGILVLWSQNDVVSGAPDYSAVGYPRLIVLLLVIAALYFGIRHRKLAFGALVLVVAVAAGDLMAANWHNNLSTANPGLTKEQATAVDYLKTQQQREGEPLRVRPQDNEALPANYGMVARVPFASGDSPIVVQRTQDLYGSPEEWRLWQISNVKYSVGNGPAGEALEHIAGSDRAKVLKNRFSLPRAWVVEDVKVAASAAQSKDMVLNGDFQPGKTGVVETPLRLNVRPASPGEEGLKQEIAFDFYSPRRLHLHSVTNRPGLLILSESYYPGWEAKLDAQAVPIRVVDHMLRGIELPAGTHVLEMVYNPASFWMGLIVSLLTLIVAFGSVVFLHFSHRKAIAK